MSDNELPGDSKSMSYETISLVLSVFSLLNLVIVFLANVDPLVNGLVLGISILLFVIGQSNQTKVKQWVMTESGWPLEQEPPTVLPSNEVVMLIPYGSLFFASAGAFEEQLPELSDETDNSVVVLDLALHSDLGSTMLEVIERYA
ncbi:MAG: hypothetical protein BMS9Abin28_1245 [Anaerolineae bacterium]|nr:MAG: hypothetical protein BMS9Abin28_1245 [Anaerolineae bacterium]